DVILEIEIEGANNIKKLIPEAVFIFIMPPSIKVMAERLKKRGTDSKEKILERFHTAYKEINEVTKYNYVVVNDLLEDAINKVEAIITSEKCRVDRIEEVFLDTKEEEIHELLIDNKEFINEDIEI
ncbi:MAG: guanylate kinase, partial [Bacilli bacterium]|nr:guanylate kinase [Bacilli bacterium]